MYRVVSTKARKYCEGTKKGRMANSVGLVLGGPSSREPRVSSGAFPCGNG